MGISPDQKVAGILAPLFALRGSRDLGVGDTRALRELVEWAATSGLAVVQILPINETGGDHSPYNIISSMALEPSTIATLPCDLPDLSEEVFEEVWAEFDPAQLLGSNVCYTSVKSLKWKLLERAFSHFQGQAKTGEAVRYARFIKWRGAQAEWLNAYVFFRALMRMQKDSEWLPGWRPEWQSLRQARDWRETQSPEILEELQGLETFFSYVQWIAYEQWMALRDYASQRGVALMGDIPVGVSRFSADVWSEPEFFDLSHSSGAPPEKIFKTDPFTAEWGQNWGFPVYNWEAMKATNYRWWRRRLRAIRSLFELVRVDHALGFFRIYSFPWQPEENSRFVGLSAEEARLLTGGELPRFLEYDDDTEAHRQFNRSRGQSLFQMMLEELGQYRLIAEDLGEVAPYVRPVLEELAIPGFKIPQWERADSERLLPGIEYPRLSLATYATHDHPPIHLYWANWQAAAEKGDQAALHAMWEWLDFCGLQDDHLPRAFDEEIHFTLLKGLFSCNSWLVIPMVSDWFGTTQQFNVPGSADGVNWTARIELPVVAWQEHWGSWMGRLTKTLQETGRYRPAAEITQDD